MAAPSFRVQMIRLRSGWSAEAEARSIFVKKKLPGAPAPQGLPPSIKTSGHLKNGEDGKSMVA